MTALRNSYSWAILLAATLLAALSARTLAAPSSPSHDAPPAPPAPQVTFRPVARYYVPQLTWLDSVPAFLIIMRNESGAALRLVGAEGNRPFVQTKRFWHSHPLPDMVALFRKDGSMLTVGPGDSVYVEVPLIDLEMDAFEFHLSSISSGPDSLVELPSGRITLTAAPYAEFLDKKEAFSTVSREYPGAQITDRNILLSFDPHVGWVWEVNFAINGNQAVHVRLNAMTGRTVPPRSPQLGH